MFKRRFTITAVGILVVLLLVAVLHAQPTSKSVAGRYQLLSSTYSIWLPTSTGTETTVFKIDTATGKTWKYTTGTVDGKHIDTWLEIPN